MTDILLSEPILNLIQQWPILAVAVGALWLMRADLKHCIKSNEDTMRALLDKILSDD